MTRQPAESRRSRSARGVAFAVGLLGDATAMTRASSRSAAASTASTSTSNRAPRSTRTVRPPHTCAVNGYIPNVGTLSMTAPPGGSTARKSRSMSSSEPLPTTTRAGSTPAWRPTASRIAVWPGSG